MRGLRSGLVMALVAVGVLASTRWTLKAQDPRVLRPEEPKLRVLNPVPAEPAARGRDGAVSVLEALERPFILPFGEPTRLEEVCRHLRMILNAPVVLDRAALDRREIKPSDTVELELHGVRLKTGLKLLLDQLGLTYKVVPEDNLLIVTDNQGSEDPLNRVYAELKSLHRDLHTLQQSVDDLRVDLGVEEEGPKMRKPTIIEEMPELPEEKPKVAPSPLPTRPRSGI